MKTILITGGAGLIGSTLAINYQIKISSVNHWWFIYWKKSNISKSRNILFYKSNVTSNSFTFKVN